MRKKINHCLKVYLVALVIFATYSITLSFINSMPASARRSEAITKEYIIKRLLYHGLSECYADSLVTEPIEIPVNGIIQAYSIFKKSTPYSYIPTGFGTSTEKYACKRENAGVFSGATPSLLSELLPSVNLSTPGNRDTYFEGMGFVGSSSAGESASGEKCFQLQYSYKDIENAETNKICFKYDGDDHIIAVSDKNDGDKKGGTYSIKLIANFNGESTDAYYSPTCTREGYIQFLAVYTIDTGLFKQHELLPCVRADEVTLDDFIYIWAGPGAKTELVDEIKYNTGLGAFEINPIVSDESSSDATELANNTYTRVPGTRIDKAMNYLTNGNRDAQELIEPLDTTELYFVYMNYFNNIYGGQVALNFCSDTNDSDIYIPVLMQDDSGNSAWKYCPVDNKLEVEGSSKKVRTGSTMDKLEKGKQIIQYLHSMSIENLEANRLAISDITPNESTTNDDPGNPENPNSDPNPSDTEATCYNSTSLSWIICAAIDLVGNTTDAIYSNIRNNYLEIGTSEMSMYYTDDDGVERINGVYYGWTVFRDFANVIFVILLILVILSQVTGIGLSNYGIKKTLPTLIMVAVLVNLSFVICQLAVDTTNILGDGLEAIFMEMGSKIDADANSFGRALAKIGGSIGLVIAGGASIAGISALTGGFNVGNILILVLAALISMFISVLFFFIVLAVRKAGVLVMVVLAPAAIICYALPNTKGLFNKWFKLFKSLLVVYPVCGLLMGAGDFFGKIIMQSGTGVLVDLVGALLQVVPFFLVPGMVKGSLALAGNIGERIGRTGKMLGHRASGSFMKSDTANRMRVGANQWGRTGGFGRAIRKVPGIGHIVRGGDTLKRKLGQTAAGRAAKSGVSKLASTSVGTKLNDVARANRARKDALAKNAYDNLRRQDSNVIERATLSDGDTLSRAMASDSQKLREELANDAFNSLNQNGTYFTSDGVEHTFNQNDAEDTAKHLGILEADYEAHQGNTAADQVIRDKIMIQINGMKKLLQNRYGSNGMSRIVESIYSLAYEPDGRTLNRNSARIATASQLARQFIKDDKLMAELHRNDPGSEQFLIDLANRDLVDNNGQLTQVATDAVAKLANGRAGYGKLSAGKVKAANLADSADTLIANWSKMDEKSDEFAKMADTFIQAISDYRTGSNFKESDINKINKELKRRYDAVRNEWMKDQANVQKLVMQLEDGTQLTAEQAYARQVEAFLPVKVGQPQFKIQQPREMPAIPEGYDADGHWDSAAMQREETKRDKLAYKNWVKRSLEIEHQNREAAKMNADLAREQEAYELKIQQQRNNNP